MTGVPFVTTYHGIYGENGAAEAALQFGDGARRRRHRQFPLHRAPRSPSATARRRSGSSSSTAAPISRASTPQRSMRSAATLCGSLGAAGRRAGRAQPRAAHRVEGAARADRGGGAAAARRAATTSWSSWPATSRAAAATAASWRRLIAARGLGKRRAHRRPLRRRRRRHSRSPTSPSSPRPSRRRSGALPSRRQAMGVPVVATALGAVPRDCARAARRRSAALRTGWLVPPERAAGALPRRSARRSR